MLVSILVGLAGGCLAVLMSGRNSDWTPELLTVQGLMGFLFLGAYVSLPVSIPAGVVGGVVAIGMLKRKRWRSSASLWLLRGAVSGAMLGVFATWMWFKVASPTMLEPPNALAIPLYGGIVGLIAGIIVGVYCKRTYVEAELAHRN